MAILSKQKIVASLIRELDHKIETAQSVIQSAKESRDNETKSSVGDKYETGRAMMQIEQQKAELQLSKILTLKKTLEQINLDQKFDKAALGALITTSQGIFFLSIGLGKIKIENELIYAISLAAPIGKLLCGIKAGDQIPFQGNMIEILNIT